MKKTFVSILFIASSIFANAQKDVYYYYDANWQAVPNKAACTYYRVVKDTKANGPKEYKDFYATGELAAEGYYISIDAENARKSVYDGKCTKYFKNGKVSETYFFEGGKSNGIRTKYYENGNIKEQFNAENGRVDGILNAFSEDQKYCTQHRFELGQMMDDYYTVSTKEGLCSRYFALSKKPYLEMPTSSDMHNHKEGENIWSTIEKNGISISINPYKVKKHGKSLRVEMNISNSSLENIPFDSNDIMILYIYRDRESRDFGINSLKSGNANIDTYRPYTLQEYVEKTKDEVENASQTFSIAEELKKVTEVYDNDNQFQTGILSSNHVRDYSYTFCNQSELAYRSYLSNITIAPLQGVCGRIEIPYEKNFDALRIIIPINGIPYTFEWERNK